MNDWRDDETRLIESGGDEWMESESKSDDDSDCGSTLLITGKKKENEISFLEDQTELGIFFRSGNCRIRNERWPPLTSDSSHPDWNHHRVSGVRITTVTGRRSVFRQQLHFVFLCVTDG